MMNKKKKRVEGILPSNTWLKENGYFSLFYFLRKTPAKFIHVKQNKLVVTIDEWVKIAEELAKNNNGFLPNCTWLIQNGYKNLDANKRKHPEKFAHIEQKNNKTDMNIYISLAEKLAKKNGGTLPCYSALVKKGHANLTSCMQKYPEKFAHVEQDYRRKTVLEWLKIAQNIKDERGQPLERTWLMENELEALYCISRRYRNLFKEIIIGK